jgi:hypothetical protein
MDVKKKWPNRSSVVSMFVAGIIRGANYLDGTL